MKEKKNKSTGKIVTIIILIILLLGTTGYICYDKFLTKEEPKQVETPKTQPTAPTQEETKITQGEIENLLKTIPYDTSKNSKNKVQTAYTTEKTTIDTIDTTLLIQYAFNNLKPNDYTTGMPKFMQNSKGKYYKSNSSNATEAQGYLSFDEVNNYIKEKYNIELDNNTLKQNSQLVEAPQCGIIYYADNYFCWLCSSGGINIEKLSNIQDYKIENNKLIINEKVGFLYTDESGINLYKTNYKENLVQSESYIPDQISEKISKQKKYFNNNTNNFNTYKHIFNIINQKYYWESTELTNNN